MTCLRPFSKGLLALSLGAFLAACEPGPDTLAPLDNRDDLPSRELNSLEAGDLLMAAGEPDDALSVYYRVANREGLTAEVLGAIGTANLALGRLNQAEKTLRASIDLDAGFATTWNNLGVVLVNRGDWAEAAEVFRVAFGLDDGESTEIRDNLRFAEQNVANIADETALPANYRLVRRGNGRYLLVGL